MKTKIQKALLVLFSLCAAGMLFTLFPIVVCPMMWLFFFIGIVVQFVWSKEIILSMRILTTLLFLFIAFRIYNDYVNDFTINPEKSLSGKFLLLALLYGVGSFLAIRVAQPVIHILTIGCLGGMLLTSVLILKETHDTVTETFQKENPDYIVLNNQETRWALRMIKDQYVELHGTSGMIHHTASDTLQGNYYSFVLCDGTAAGTVPILIFVTMLNLF